MKVGERASVTRTFDADLLADFAGLAGSPDTRLNAVPEPLVAGLFSYLLGVQLPGSGTNYLKQDIRFHAPAPVGEPITATVEITGFRSEKHLCDLATTCTDAAGRTIATGRALVYVRDVPRPAEGPGAAGFNWVVEQGAGRPVVLLHGWAAQSGFFREQLALAGSGCRVIVPDLPGHGRDRRPDAPLAIADLADALAAFLEARDLRGVVLAGWSMGATVALDFIARHGTARLAGLATIDMTAKVANDAGWRLGLASGLDAAAGERGARMMEVDWLAYAPRVAGAIYAASLPRSHPLRDEATAMFVGNDGLPMASLWRSLIAADHRETLARLDIPALVMAGVESLLYRPEVARWMATAIPDARLVEIAAAGHTPHLEQPAAFNAALLDFVAAVSGPIA